MLVWLKFQSSFDAAAACWWYTIHFEPVLRERASGSAWQFIMRVFLYSAQTQRERESVLLKYRSLCARARHREHEISLWGWLGEADGGGGRQGRSIIVSRVSWWIEPMKQNKKLSARCTSLYTLRACKKILPPPAHIINIYKLDFTPPLSAFVIKNKLVIDFFCSCASIPLYMYSHFSSGKSL